MKAATHASPTPAPTHQTRARDSRSQRRAERSHGLTGVVRSQAQRPAPEGQEVVQRRLEQAFGPVQREPEAAHGQAGREDPQAIHQAAARGTSGAGGPLPYLQQIQKAFGRFDVSGVQAYSGQQATAAARAMGASAYTAGNKVAFAGAPSLHTAAHEAAHTVQQRAGVQLKAGVGQEGDPYERHADAVADAVVAGRSAETLLAAAPSGGGSAAAVQRKGTIGFEFQASNAHIYRAVEKREERANNKTHEKLKGTEAEVDVLGEQDDPTTAQGIKAKKGNLWVEHRRIGAGGGAGKAGGVKGKEWYQTVKPVIEASAGQALDDRNPSNDKANVGTVAEQNKLYQRNVDDPILVLTDKFKCTGDGGELEIVTIPAEDTFEKMDALFKDLESYVNGLEAAPKKWYKIASEETGDDNTQKVSTDETMLRMTKVANGYIGVDAVNAIRARPQVTYNMKFEDFPKALKTFSKKEHYREAKAGAATQKPLAELAKVELNGLPQGFQNMNAEVFGVLMYIAHIVITARSSAADSLGKDLAALAPRQSLKAELQDEARKKAFTDENMLAILKKADATIKLNDPLAYKAANHNGFVRNNAKNTTIGEYFAFLRGGANSPSFLARIIGW